MVYGCCGKRVLCGGSKSISSIYSCANPGPKMSQAFPLHSGVCESQTKFKGTVMGTP